MLTRLRPALLAVPLACGCSMAFAAPLDPASGVEPPVYSSAFERYRPWEEVEPGGWAEANERVGRIGGWRTYLREADEAEPAREEKAR